MNVKYKLTKEAEIRLQQIYLYGIDNWNEHVADEYHQGFFDTFNRIAKYPKAGSAEEYVKGLSRKRHGKHFIFYSVHENYVTNRKNHPHVQKHPTTFRRNITIPLELSSSSQKRRIVNLRIENLFYELRSV